MPVPISPNVFMTSLVVVAAKPKLFCADLVQINFDKVNINFVKYSFVKMKNILYLCAYFFNFLRYVTSYLSELSCATPCA